MNILLLANHLNAGGISSYLILLGKGLKEKGHNVSIVSSGGNMVDDLESKGIVHIQIDMQTKSELSVKVYQALHKLVRLVRKEQIDIIHANTRVTQVIGQLLSQITGRVYISTCHGFFKKRLGRQLYPCWGDCVIAISEAVAQHLIKDFGVPSSRIALIPNGVDPRAYPLMDEDLKKIKKHKLSLKNGPLIGIISRLSDVKGHQYLIEAMPRVVYQYIDASLLIVGEGKMDASLRALVKEKGLEDHIKFHPMVGKTAELLPLFDIFVMPSIQEGLGLAVMEAQAAGLPVIASNVGGLPSIVKHQQTGLLVPPRDSEALADAILWFLDNKEEAKRIGSQAKAFIQEEFPVIRMVEKTMGVYEKVYKKNS